MTAFATKPAADAPYALHGERICDLGYSCIPCRPGSKRPGSYSGGQWWGRMDWSQYCDRAPTEYELRCWTRWPDAGLCVALGFNDVIAIDVDTDDDAMISALAAVIPHSTVQKRGEKGFTASFPDYAEGGEAAGSMRCCHGPRARSARRSKARPVRFPPRVRNQSRWSVLSRRSMKRL